MHNNRSTIRRVVTFGLAFALGLSFLTGTASAAGQRSTSTKERGNQGQTSSTKDCDGTHSSKTGNGANDSEPHAYNETCDEDVASGNGGGNGEAGGKPCAGCVGNADDKNPPGQYPSGPGDHNNGYECDQKGRSENEGNNGIGFGNPAHSGCAGDDTTGGEQPPAPVCPAAGAASMTDHSFVVDHKRYPHLDGNVDPKDDVVADFTIAGCVKLPVTLIAYEIVGGEKKEFDKATGNFAAGSHTLDVDTPRCAFAVDFIVDGVVVDSDEEMNASCDKPVVPATSAPVTPAAVLAGVLSASVDATPAALPAAAVAETPAASIIPDTPAAAVRATEVQGVQLERGSVGGDDPAVAGAGLARTGLTLLPLAGLGSALCLLGIALSSARRREGGQGFVTIGDRLAGF